MGSCAPAQHRPPRRSGRPLFWLSPTSQTALLARSPIVWNCRYSGKPEANGTQALAAFEHTHYSVLQNAVVRLLANHQACTNDSSKAAACIVASPPGGKCHDWGEVCPPPRRIFVVDVPDAELTQARGAGRLCPTLWACNASRAFPRVVRVTGNAPLHRPGWACEARTEERSVVTVVYVTRAQRQVRR